MDKIAIITLYYKNYNYGGQLQAYALQKVLDNLGYDCRQISFQRQRKDVFFRKIRAWFYESAVEKRKFITSKIRKVKGIVKKEEVDTLSLQKFNEWMEQIPHTEVVTRETVKQLNEDFDIFIVGSDQVWNPEFVPMTFFFDFTENKKKRLSYAASIRIGKYEKKEGEIIKGLLERFHYISVREETAVQVLRQSGVTKPIDVSIDPTMLLSREEWDQVAREPDIKEDYIFTYLVSDPFAVEQIRFFAIQQNCKVVSVMAPGQKTREDEVYVRIKTGVGPAEFIGLIRQARFVFVESFHGTAFSLLYHKPFLVFGEEDDDRKKTILKLVGLTGCLIDRKTVWEKYNFDSISFEKTDQIIQTIAKKSLERLVTAIKA